VANLYFVGVFEGYRRHGYATQALRLLEQEVWQAGLDEIRLYVFGHNSGAWHLYQKMGYAPVSLTLSKRVGGT
jgi:ribosomal protein S18 acetylase RimI-like enzyme